MKNKIILFKYQFTKYQEHQEKELKQFDEGLSD